MVFVPWGIPDLFLILELLIRLQEIWAIFQVNKTCHFIFYTAGFYIFFDGKITGHFRPKFLSSNNAIETLYKCVPIGPNHAHWYWGVLIFIVFYLYKCLLHDISSLYTLHVCSLNSLAEKFLNASIRIFILGLFFAMQLTF